MLTDSEMSNQSYVRASKCYVSLGQLDKAEEVLAQIDDASVTQQRRLVQRIRFGLERALDQLERSEYSASKMSALMVLEHTDECVLAKVVLIDSLIGLKEYDEARKLAK